MFFHPHLDKKGKKKIAWYVDHLIYIAGVFGVGVYIPQLMKVWTEQNAEGLSLITWIGFILGSLFWLLFGVVHRQKPIIFINACFAIVQAFILFGIILYS